MKEPNKIIDKRIDWIINHPGMYGNSSCEVLILTLLDIKYDIYEMKIFESREIYNKFTSFLKDKFGTSIVPLYQCIVDKYSLDLIKDRVEISNKLSLYLKEFVDLVISGR